MLRRFAPSWMSRFLWSMARVPKRSSTVVGSSSHPSVLLAMKAIAVQHCCFDRALFGPLDRLFRQLHELQYREPFCLLPEGARELARATDWFVTTPCCCHDCHNALRWGLHEFLSIDGLTEDFYIILESLRNSYDLIVGHLHSWLSTKVVFCARVASQEVLFQFWTMLGIEGEYANIMSELSLCSRMESSSLILPTRLIPTHSTKWQPACYMYGGSANSATPAG